jgi:hypothetical protein
LESQSGVCTGARGGRTATIDRDEDPTVHAEGFALSNTFDRLSAALTRTSLDANPLGPAGPAGLFLLLRRIQEPFLNFVILGFWKRRIWLCSAGRLKKLPSSKAWLRNARGEDC